MLTSYASAGRIDHRVRARARAPGYHACVRTKVVSFVAEQPEQLEELARFELREDGTVTATYADPADRDWLGHIKVRGIAGPVTVDAGRVFFDGLDAAFARSSRVVVRELG